MDSLNNVVVIVLILCSVILAFLWKSRKVPTYTLKQCIEKQTSTDKLITLKYWFKTIQELVGMGIIGSAINTIQNESVLTWVILIYGLALYLIIALAIYNFEITLIDLKKRQQNKQKLDKDTTDSNEDDVE